MPVELVATGITQVPGTSAEEVIQFIDTTGAIHTLAAEHGVEGRFMPPVSFIEDEVPEQPGSRLRVVRIGPREVAVPVWFRGTSASDLRAELRRWLGRLNPSKGTGRLRNTAPDGVVRDLYCVYAGGMELVEDDDTAGVVWQKAMVIFRGHDPYWYDSASTVATYTIGVSPATFFPIFPMRLSSSDVFADATINNTGDVEAWPVVTITGPGSDPVLRNLTTGEVTQFSGLTLAGGEMLTIDTRPNNAVFPAGKTVKKGDGTNLFPYLTDASSLWPLAEGSNSVRLELSSATSSSSVTLSYQRRFLGP